LPALALAGGTIGCVVEFSMQYYALVISYPLNMGGRPYEQLAFLHPVTF
jgi:hypothetical protein